MAKRIIAIFDDITIARQVVEDLVAANFPRETISLITNDANNRYSHYLDKDYIARVDAVTTSEGAGFGAGVGALMGLLVGFIGLAIPSIGLIVVVSPIVGGLIGGVVGAITGGIVGMLVKSRVPEDEALYYAEGIQRGGTLISVDTSDRLRAEDIMNRYGSINIHERANLWRQAGWKGFEGEEDGANTPKSSSEVHSTISTDTTTTRVTHIIGTLPVVAPSINITNGDEPKVEEEDTIKLAPIVDDSPMPDDKADLITPIYDEQFIQSDEQITPMTEETMSNRDEPVPHSFSLNWKGNNHPKG